MNYIKFLEGWYQANCNSDWEHNFGIKIETLDNPGWYIEVDLEDTFQESLDVKEIFLNSEIDWLRLETKNKKLIGSADPTKLETLLLRIRELLDEK